MPDIKWGWMHSDATDTRAAGPFDSCDAAMVDAYKTLGESGEEEATIQIDHMFKPDFLSCLPDADDLVEQAGECFSGIHGRCDDYIFELAGRSDEATKDLVESIRDWAEKWVENNVSWWMDGSSEELHIRADDTDPRNKERNADG